MFKDYYLILEIEEDAALEEIKAAYRNLIKRYHPDVNKDEDAHHKTIEVIEAFQLLNDKEARERYNSEYRKYHSQKQSEQIRNVDEYISDDEILNKWMWNAQKQARDLYQQVTDEFRESIKESGKGVLSFLNYIWPFLLGYLLFKACTLL
ncbi:DnaJ domain-containing protein [Bacteroidales bacterium OttesenSCG-928-M11]|nr:DnaJ domain-containing protein [Bacteroidales bacterium OttesenSCG-928-M11]